jgi:nucleoside-diphosphate-sugar epimerase
MKPIKRVLVTGGAGYVGAVLVPKLLNQGYRVRVLDLFLYGTHVLDPVKDHPGLEQISGDIRNRALLEKVLPGCDAVIHLACISNDPSFELNPELGKSINYDAFFDLVDVSKASGVHRFIFASSSSVYGVSEVPDVTENMELKPLTDYSKYKALCEDVLLAKREPGFHTLILRPATVCGYSPRQRLDLVVNILTNHGITNGQIKVFGGDQMRPNIHINDVTDLYVKSLSWADEAIDGNIFNAGYDNKTVMGIAESVRDELPGKVDIITVPTDDHRSYQISSAKIEKDLGFIAKLSVEDGVRDLVKAFNNGKLLDPMNNIGYYNIKTMQAVSLK